MRESVCVSTKSESYQSLNSNRRSFAILPQRQLNANVLDSRRISLARQVHDDIAERLGQWRELALDRRGNDTIVNVAYITYKWGRRTEAIMNTILQADSTKVGMMRVRGHR